MPQMIKNQVNHSITLTHRNFSHSLLWMHGLGDTAASYIPFFGHLKSPLYNQTRIKLLQAPSRFTTLNNR